MDSIYSTFEINVFIIISYFLMPNGANAKWLKTEAKNTCWNG